MLPGIVSRSAAAKRRLFPIDGPPGVAAALPLRPASGGEASVTTTSLAGTARRERVGGPAGGGKAAEGEGAEESEKRESCGFDADSGTTVSLQHASTRGGG